MNLHKLEDRVMLSVVVGGIRWPISPPQMPLFPIVQMPGTAPTRPPNLTVTSRTDTTVTIHWGPSSDDVGVSGYEVLRNGSLIKTLSQNQRTFTSTGLKPNTNYVFSVRAFDTDGNRSPLSTVQIKTTNTGTGDNGHGLLGTYFNDQFLNNAVAQRVDPKIDFNFGTGSPINGVGADNFSVRWTGQIQPQHSEKYTFFTTTDDGVTLTINGQTIINHFLPQGRQTFSSAPIQLVAGKKYDIEMDYFDFQGNAEAHLSWSSSSTPRQIVPSAALFHPAAPVAPSNVRASRFTFESILVQWDDLPNETSFIVQRSVDGQTGWQTIFQSLPNVTFVVDTNLPQHTTFFYRVLAANSLGTSPPSEVVSATT
jgi:hypothetical protein